MVNTLYIVALVAIFAALADATTNYCNLSTCTRGPHTICKYGSLRVNHGRCGQLNTTSLTSEEILSILHAHNDYRAKVARGDEHRGNPGPQPAAINLQPLRWDEELADIAQSWANQCNYNHDDCRDSARFRVGQNIAFASSSSADYPDKWTDMVKAWYDEVEIFDKNQVNSYVYWYKIAHYSQMVWAETTKVGCGGVRYNNDGRWYTTYLVCNYGPGGNNPNQRVYQTRLN